MGDFEFECEHCGDDIKREQVLIHLAREGYADQVVEEERPVEMDCPHCREQVPFESSEVVVRLSTDDAILTVFDKLRKGELDIDRRRMPDLEQTIERQRESLERLEELKENLEARREEFDS